ncbi:hypothetical protein C4565_03645 [Candidatus Parcubacteria bacterium]|nr:MAG: hypothetical protein C4565_03645 [Candidatus Parcubacteria bacterium]
MFWNKKKQDVPQGEFCYSCGIFVHSRNMVSQYEISINGAAVFRADHLNARDYSGVVTLTYVTGLAKGEPRITIRRRCEQCSTKEWTEKLALGGTLIDIN